MRLALTLQPEAPGGSLAQPACLTMWTRCIRVPAPPWRPGSPWTWELLGQSDPWNPAKLWLGPISTHHDLHFIKDEHPPSPAALKKFNTLFHSSSIWSDTIYNFIASCTSWWLFVSWIWAVRWPPGEVAVMRRLSQPRTLVAISPDSKIAKSSSASFSCPSASR